MPSRTRRQLVEDQPLDRRFAARQAGAAARVPMIERAASRHRRRAGRGRRQGAVRRPAPAPRSRRGRRRAVGRPRGQLDQGRQRGQPEIGGAVQRRGREGVHHRRQAQPVAVEIGARAPSRAGCRCRRSRPGRWSEAASGRGDDLHPRRPAERAEQRGDAGARTSSSATARRRRPGRGALPAWPSRARGCRRSPPAPSGRAGGSWRHP